MFRKTLAAVAFSVLTIGSANALTIDDFSVTQILSDPGPSFSTVSGTSTSIIGTERSASVTRDSGADPATLAFNSGSTGTMSISNGPGGTSTSVVVWDGVGTAGLGGEDLTVGGAQDAFDLRLIANDFAAQIIISVTDTLGNVSDLNQSSPGGIPGPADIPLLFEFANFSPLSGAGANFSTVDSIVLTVIADLNQTDIELDFFGTTTTEMSEPGMIAVLGLSLLGLRLARRRLR